MSNTTARAFKRKEINCSFKCLPSEKKEMLDKKTLEASFFTDNYLEFAREIDNPMEVITNENQKVIADMIKSKFKLITKKIYPEVFKETNKVTISRKGIAFFSQEVLCQDDTIYLMFIFPNEINPCFISGFILRADPLKQKQGYVYIINFDHFYQETADIFNKMDI